MIIINIIILIFSVIAASYDIEHHRSFWAAWWGFLAGANFHVILNQFLVGRKL